MIFVIFAVWLFALSDMAVVGARKDKHTGMRLVFVMNEIHIIREKQTLNEISKMGKTSSPVSSLTFCPNGRL